MAHNGSSHLPAKSCAESLRPFEPQRLHSRTNQRNHGGSRLTGGKHEQIRDKASDIGRVHDAAAGDFHDQHTGPGRDDQQQACKASAQEEHPKEPWGQ
jgi:hypothetical protein